jgi:hypothetical protein
MAKTLPAIGEQFLGKPEPRRIDRITVGTATDNDVVIASTGTYVLWNVPANLIVFDLCALVTTALTTDADLSVGPATDLDGFMLSTDLNVLGTDTEGYFNSSTGASLASGPYRFDAASTISMSLYTNAVTAGAVEFLLDYAIAGND